MSLQLHVKLVFNNPDLSADKICQETINKIHIWAEFLHLALVITFLLGYAWVVTGISG